MDYEIEIAIVATLIAAEVTDAQLLTTCEKLQWQHESNICIVAPSGRRWMLDKEAPYNVR